MKAKFIKSIAIMLSITLVLGFIIPNCIYSVYATETEEELTDAQIKENEEFEKHETFLGAAVDGIAGILTWPLRALIWIFGKVMRVMIGGIAILAGDDGGIFDTNIRTRRYFI